MTTRRETLAAIAAVAGWGIEPARAQVTTWPQLKPVTLVVPYGASGAPDAMTRLVAEVFKKRFGQSFVVENKPGAGANIGAAYVARAKPDGYTLLSAPVGTFAINEFLYDSLPYAPADLVPISLLFEIPNVFLVPADHPSKTLAEYVEVLKRRGKSVTFGSPGIGNSAHLWGELFRTRIGVEGVHTPFTSGQQVTVSMLQGDVDYAIDVLGSYRPFLQAGKLKALAITGATRSPLFPDVPTMEESGFSGFDLTTWVALSAPRGTPAEVLTAVSQAQQSVAQDPEMQKQFTAAGVRIASSTPSALQARIERERPRWQQLIKLSGAKVG